MERFSNDKMRFKISRLKEEFWQLESKLRKILCDLDHFCIEKFGRDIMLTSLIRKDNPNSVHFYCRGADVRSKDFSPDRVKLVLEYINSKYPYGKKNLKTMIQHNVGQGEHFHIQVSEVKSDV